MAECLVCTEMDGDICVRDMVAGAPVCVFAPGF